MCKILRNNYSFLFMATALLASCQGKGNLSNTLKHAEGKVLGAEKNTNAKDLLHSNIAKNRTLYFYYTENAKKH